MLLIFIFLKVSLIFVGGIRSFFVHKKSSPLLILIFPFFLLHPIISFFAVGYMGVYPMEFLGYTYGRDSMAMPLLPYCFCFFLFIKKYLLFFFTKNLLCTCFLLNVFFCGLLGGGWKLGWECKDAWPPIFL